MTITIEPTEEMHEQALIDGRSITLRVWTGFTDMGTPLEAYVFAVVPREHTDAAASVLRNQFPSYMKWARDQFELKVDE